MKQFNKLFWFLPKNTELNLENDKHQIIHQVLALGSMDDVRKLFNIYGVETVKKEFLKPQPGLYSPSVLELFCCVFDVENINKSKYLKNIYAPAQRNIRQK